MTTKKQSAKAWTDLLDRNVIGGQWFSILEAAISLSIPSTAAELARHAGLHRSGHKRVSELRRAGYLEEDKPRTCEVTGRESTTWRLVDLPPEHKTGRAGVVPIAKLGRATPKPSKPSDALSIPGVGRSIADMEEIDRLTAALEAEKKKVKNLGTHVDGLTVERDDRQQWLDDAAGEITKADPELVVYADEDDGVVDVSASVARLVEALKEAKAKEKKTAAELGALREVLKRRGSPAATGAA